MSKKLHDEMEEFAVSDEELEKNITDDEDDDTEYNEEESENENEGSENEGSENEGSENEGSENEGSENEGSENEGSENEGSENEGSDNEGSDNEDNNEKKQNAKKVAAAKNKGKLNAAQSGMIGIPHGLENSDSDNSDSESDDEYTTSRNNEYFQKLDKNIRKNYIAEYHPEVLIHNYDEIMNMAKVVRDKNGVIVDELHRTIPIMTKYERTRILGQRTKQLNEGAKPMIKVDSTVIDGYLIALKELEQKRIPFIIRRPLPSGGSEYWRVQDLEIL